MKLKIKTIKSKIKSKDGFSLVEVLIALYLLTYGLVGTLYALTSSSALLLQVQQNAIATQALQERIESIRNMDYDKIVINESDATCLSASFTSTNFTKFKNPAGSLSVITPSGYDTNIKLVTATITWDVLDSSKTGSRQLSKSISTLITKDGVDQ